PTHKPKRQVKPIQRAEESKPASKPIVKSSTYAGCGPGIPCRGDQKVVLSFHAYPQIVHQLGDVIRYYFKTTNISNEDIAGPIDFYMSGQEEPIATLDSLAANSYYEL